MENDHFTRFYKQLWRASVFVCAILAAIYGIIWLTLLIGNTLKDYFINP